MNMQLTTRLGVFHCLHFGLWLRRMITSQVFLPSDALMIVVRHVRNVV